MLIYLDRKWWEKKSKTKQNKTKKTTNYDNTAKQGVYKQKIIVINLEKIKYLSLLTKSISWHYKKDI